MKISINYFFLSTAFFLLNLSFFNLEKNKITNFSTIQKIKTSKLFPSDNQFIKRTFPYYDYNINAYSDAIKELKEMKKVQKLQKTKNNPINTQWEFLGPINIGGRIVDIEFNPKNPEIVYAAAATGGVFKSINTGQNWFPVFDDQPNLSIGDIAIDPNNPNIIYVGTGEANGGHNNFPGMGVYKSYDAGNSWQFIGLDSTVSIGRIVIDPSNSQKVFVAAVGSYFKPNPQRGVYISENGGNTWKKSLFVSDSTGAIDLVINPNNPNIIFAAMWERVRRPVYRETTHLNGPSGGIFKSIDGGNNWDKLGINNNLPDPEVETIGRIGLSISFSNPNIIYALYNNGTSPTGLYKSIDDGETWVRTNDRIKGSSTFSWYFGQIRVHPNDPQTIYVMDVPLLKSTDSGTTWEFSYGYGGPSKLHVDHHALAFHPNNPDYILSGNDGGINISQDGGLTWSEPVDLPVTQFYEIGLDETNPERYFGGTQDNNTVRTVTGIINDWDNIYGGDGFYVIVNPDNPDIIYAESQFGGLGKSEDGGNSFTYVLNGVDSNEPTNWSTPVVMAPNNPNVLYYGTHSLYRTVDAADTWTVVSSKLTDYEESKRLGTITTIAVAPTDSNVIYVGTDDGHVWVSSDYAETWKDISVGLPFRWVTRVVVDPSNENTVYVTFSGLRWADPEPRVFRSADMGKTWENINSNLPDAPINAFAVDYNNPDYLYLGNDIGTFISRDAGQTWEILGNGLPIVVVSDMKIHPVANYLAIGTHGRGFYKIDLNSITGTNKAENSLPNSIQLAQNYPNPFNPSTIIKYSIPKGVVGASHDLSVQLKIFDVLGREIKTLVNTRQKPGNYKVTFNASDLPSGNYFYRLQVGNFILTKKMSLVK